MNGHGLALRTRIVAMSTTTLSLAALATVLLAQLAGVWCVRVGAYSVPRGGGCQISAPFTAGVMTSVGILTMLMLAVLLFSRNRTATIAVTTLSIAQVLVVLYVFLPPLLAPFGTQLD